MDTKDIKAQPDRRILIALFSISGFTGLIYESIWTHYLRLFLGHAAYAQSLVLAIFMGGMALGAWMVSRNTIRWTNLVRVYAVAEACIGLAALFFHDGFSAFLELSFTSVIPALNSAQLVDAYKWSMATLLIAPQSILLGMTFPLMAGGVVRRFPGETGRDLALLYFANSLGAAIGALASGFWLIQWLGLPGTIRSAGVVNLCLAAVVWRIATEPESAAFQRHAPELKNNDKHVSLFLVGAFITGAASFVYEIAWIRMLSLVLGTTFQAFELMISAFITGIALGGWWIRKRIDRIEDPVRFLGLIQIVMGMLALATLSLYNHTFSWIGWLVNNLEATDGGYMLFNFGSHAVAFVIMLPATFCAGMTLPLFTHVLIKRGHGEKSIGQIYASNTLGSISGVMFAVHLGMPLFGLKLLMVIGASLDVALGMVLLRYVSPSLTHWRTFAPPLLAVFGITFVVRFVDFDPLRMASGVYRTGEVAIKNSQMLFHRDGKTASISAYSPKQGAIIITTNGKPDASIIVDPAMGSTRDEITMVMAAALPLALKPDAKKIANIGFGSGLTTHTFLEHPGISAVDSIEIEAAMIEGAKYFMARVSNAYNDSRSQIHIEDAKTWFAKSQEKFDVIVSEPSNPWVSGVGSLFSEEFYRQVKYYLNNDGLLIQWLQLYEFNDRLAASVLAALDRNFDDYAIFNTDNYNVLIVAPNNGEVPHLSDALFRYPSMRRELAKVGILGPQDIELRRIGSKKILSPLFAKLGVQANSDYHPYLGLHGPRARFKKEVASTLTYLALAPLPLLEMLDSPPEWWQQYPVVQTNYWRSQRAVRASQLQTALISPSGLSRPLAKDDAAIIQKVLLGGERCERGDAVAFDPDLHELAISTLPYLNSRALIEMWNAPRWEHCDAQKSQIALYQHIARRDPVAMLREAASQLEPADAGMDPSWRRYVFAAALLGAQAQNRPDQTQRLFSNYAGEVYPDGNIDTYVLALVD